MVALDSLSKDALTLPPDERVALARRLLISVEPKPSPEIDIAWENEILRRIAEFDSGRVQTVSADAVFARLRKIAPDE
jgi:putative addiction module component (TIGR02574 family)